MSAVKPAPEKGGRSEGTWGEALAAEYLRQRGCRLAAHSSQNPGSDRWDTSA